jgi:hypothetical protein
MKFYYSKRLLWGSLIGIYYGEKRLPFPIQYQPKKDEVGNIKIDLSIINSVLHDLAKLANSFSQKVQK